MKTNVKEKIFTHEGARAKIINAEQQLRRSVMACLLWEKEFYEDGESIAQRIADTIPSVKPEVVSNIAIEAREKMKLRHVPLFIVREMARLDTHKMYVKSTLERIIQRADELAEFVAIYWKDRKQPLSSQIKRGLAAAFTKFSAYELAKYNRDGSVKLRDVLFLCHAKPKDEEQANTWKKLVDGTLEAPDTWEVALSSGADKKEAWERLISENRLGAMAFLRNLRNMQECGVDMSLIKHGLQNIKASRVLPFRFIAAARYAPSLEEDLERVMMKCIADYEKLSGKTVLLIDVSGSMNRPLSSRSDMSRMDAACGLAILARELCENVEIYTFSNNCVIVPNRRGFALRDAVVSSQPHSSTNMGEAVRRCNSIPHNRIIVITDEQSHDDVPDPSRNGYMINVASYRNGVGYAKWTHIDGWSESIIGYIHEIEKSVYATKTAHKVEQ